MENKQKPAAIDIQDSTNIRMTDVNVRGYQAALRTKNTHNLDVKNFSTERNSKGISSKWYKDRNFIITLVGVIVAVIIGYLTI